MEDHLNNYFKEYLINYSDKPPFINVKIYGDNITNKTTYKLSVRLNLLKPYILAKHESSDINFYISEILIHLLKNEIDLGLVDVEFYEPYNTQSPSVLNLGWLNAKIIVKKVYDNYVDVKKK